MSEEKEVRTLHSVFSKVDKLKQHKRKVDLLKKEEDFAIKSVLQGCYLPRVNFKMPDGPPPYTPKEEDVEITEQIIRQIAKALDFNRHQWDRERVYTQILESVSAEDAKILVAMKDKDMTVLYPSITKELVREAYPNLGL